MATGAERAWRLSDEHQTHYVRRQSMSALGAEAVIVSDDRAGARSRGGAGARVALGSRRRLPRAVCNLALIRRQI